mmetsp:Transcript_31751/g.72221  ORF Transcript_31751/g.72221 Transcript_31751/m.72221 type:complete len:210 (+) Transcript_31751:438-1067(+)
MICWPVSVPALGMGIVFTTLVANLLIVHKLFRFHQFHALAKEEVLPPRLPPKPLPADLCGVFVRAHRLLVEHLHCAVELWSDVVVTVALLIVLLPVPLPAIQGECQRKAIACVRLQVLARPLWKEHGIGVNFHGPVLVPDLAAGDDEVPGLHEDEHVEDRGARLLVARLRPAAFRIDQRVHFISRLGLAQQQLLGAGDQEVVAGKDADS